MSVLYTVSRPCMLNRYLNHYHGIPFVCWQRIILCFVNNFSGGITFFLSIYFVNHLHLNLTLSGLLISSYGFGTIFGGYFGGRFSDKISPTLITSIGCFVKSIGFFLLIFITQFWWLFINQFLIGVATYAFKSSNTTWTLQQCTEDSATKLKVINCLYSATNLGLGLSAVMVGILSHYSFNLVFSFSSLLLIGAGVWLVYQLKQSSDLCSASKKIEKITETSAALSKNFWLLWLALGCLFLGGLILAQLSNTYPVYLHNIFPGLGINAFSIIFILNTFMVVTCQTPLLNLIESQNKVKMLGIGLLLLGGGMMLLLIAHNYISALISAFIWTLGEMIFIAMAQFISYQQSNVNQRGRAQGLYQMTYAISVTIGPTLGGLLYHHLGGNSVWFACGCIGLLGFILCMSWNKS